MKRQVRRRREMWRDIHANKTPPGTYLLKGSERVLTREEAAADLNRVIAVQVGHINDAFIEYLLNEQKQKLSIK